MKLAREAQPDKTPAPRVRGKIPLVCDLLGKLTEVNDVQLPKHWSPIKDVVTDGNAIDVRPEHPKNAPA